MVACECIRRRNKCTGKAGPREGILSREEQQEGRPVTAKMAEGRGGAVPPDVAELRGEGEAEGKTEVEGIKKIGRLN